MSKRLQVLMDEREWRTIRKAARGQHTTLSNWVRQVLRDAAAREPLGDRSAKLKVIRAAADNDFPAADIEQMNSEIASGYVAGWRK